VFGIALPATLGAGLEQALAGLDQGGDFGRVQRAAVEADRANFAIERLRDFEVGSLGVELGAAYVCFRCEETVDVDKRFVVAAADDNGDVAPLIRMEDTGAGGDGGGRASGLPGRLKAQRCPVVGDFEEPAARAVTGTQTDDGMAAGLLRLDPGGDREVSFPNLARVIGRQGASRDRPGRRARSRRS